MLAGALLQTVFVLPRSSFRIDRVPFLLDPALDLTLTSDFAAALISRPQYQCSRDCDRERDQHDHRVPSQARRVHAVSVLSVQTTLRCASVREDTLNRSRTLRVTMDDRARRRQLRVQGALMGVPGIVLMALSADASGWPSTARVALLLVGIALLVAGLAFQTRGTRL
jgi:hypothetical protein